MGSSDTEMKVPSAENLKPLATVLLSNLQWVKTWLWLLRLLPEIMSVFLTSTFTTSFCLHNKMFIHIFLWRLSRTVHRTWLKPACNRLDDLLATNEPWYDLHREVSIMLSNSVITMAVHTVLLCSLCGRFVVITRYWFNFERGIKCT